MPGLIVKAVLVLIGCLVVADVAGVIVCTLFDISPFRGNSAALPYAIWLVLGVFCGLIAYNVAGAWSLPKGAAPDWTGLPAAARTGTGILVTSTVVIAALAALFYRLYWSRGVAGEYYVPDSAPHSIVFFVSVLAMMALARFKLMPGPAMPPL